MDEFAHGGASDGFDGLTVAFDTLTEVTDHWIMLPSHERRQVLGLSQGGTPALEIRLLPVHVPDYWMRGARPAQAMACLALAKP